MNSLQSHLQSVASVVLNAEAYRWKIDWLNQLDFHYASVANYGCNVGYEALALAWILGATECVGVDKDEDSINQAKSMVTYFFEDIENVQRALYYLPEISQELRHQAESMASEYRKKIVPSYVVANMTHLTPLPAAHFDLAYCERVLYHFACQKDIVATKDTLSAIQEMTRVIKPGGILVAIEPNTCSRSDVTAVRLEELFSRTELTPVEVDATLFVPENESVYLYSKPN